MPLYLEVGNVLTRAMRLDPVGPGGSLAVREKATPTTVYEPFTGPAAGCEAVLAAAAAPEAATAQDVPLPAAAGGVALVHLDGAPRTAVIGLAGLPSTELTIQAALRQAGSSVVQIRSTDAANLEAQLVDLRTLPLDILAFTAPSDLTAERLLAGGGVRPRVLERLLAVYNGPEGEHGPIEGILKPAADLSVLPPVRIKTNVLDARPTEAWVKAAADQIMAADPLASSVRSHGLAVHSFARAFTAAAELAAASMSTSAGNGTAKAGQERANGGTAREGVLLVDLGGRYTEVAGASGGSVLASRLVEDLNDLVLAVGGGQAKADTSKLERVLDVEAIGRWLPFEWATTGLADALANYLRRPFIFPAGWRQLLTLLALGRVRLARVRSQFRGGYDSGLPAGDWRPATRAYILSGGYCRNLPGPGLALALLLDGLEPTGVSELWCDRYGLLPFLAMSGAELPLSGQDPLVPRMATVVAPALLAIDWRKPHEDDLLALVTVKRENGSSTTFRIVPGGLLRFPLRPGERAQLTVHPMRENDFGAGPGKVWRGEVVGGLLGLVFDARGRPVALPADGKVRQAKLLEWLATLDASRSRWEVDRP